MFISNVKMKILHYLPDLDKSSGGVLSYIQVLAAALGDAVELHLLTCHTDNEMSVSDKCSLHYLSVRYIPRWDTKSEFLRVLDEVKPDVFHTNSCWIPTSAYTVIWAKNAGYKVIYTTHGMMEPWIMKRNYWLKKWPALMLYQKKAIKMADVIHATSHNEMVNLLALGYNKNICIVANTIDVSSVTMKTSWKKNKNILFLGRIHEKKGLRHLLEAICELKKSCLSSGLAFDYKVQIVGDSDIEQPRYKDELVTMAKALNLDDCVSFHDGVYGDEKWNYFRQADVFVLPTYSENFGIVVVEALACGTPVITTTGTPWSELKACDCGWWTEIGTLPLIEALKDYMAKSDEQIEEMGKRGRQLVENRFGIDTIKKEYLAMYRFVME